MEHKLVSKWSLWFRDHESRDWSLDSYKKVFDFDTVEAFWGLMKNIKYVEHMFFFMKDGITPIFEDEANQNGGQVSFVLPLKQTLTVLTDLTLRAISEQICSDPSYVNGVSLSVKNGRALFKIWIKNIDEFEEKLNNGSISLNGDKTYFVRYRIKRHE